MQILIKDNWALNLWDVAIAESMINQISDAFPWSQIILESSHPDIALKYFSHDTRVKIIWRLYDVSDIQHSKKLLSLQFISKNSAILLRLIKVSFLGFFFAFFWLSSKNPTLLAYKNSDLIVSAGWDFLSKNYAYYLRLYEFFLIKKLWKPVFLYAQSIWPFHKSMNWLVKKSLNSLDGIFARDEQSLVELKSIGVEKNVYKTADSVILLKPSKTQRIESFMDENTITKGTIWLVVRDIKYTEIWDDQYESYLRWVASVVQYLENEDKTVILIAPNGEDYVISAKLIKKYDLKSKLISTADFLPSEIKYLLSQLYFLISWRMHPIIIWSTAWVPVIWLGLEFKMKNYLNAIWLWGFSIDMIPFDTEKCIHLIKEIESNHDNMVTKLNQEIIKITELSKKNPMLLKEIYSKTIQTSLIKK
jgi:colanic acid/amylovoran biosynthesis protein